MTIRAAKKPSADGLLLSAIRTCTALLMVCAAPLAAADSRTVYQFNLPEQTLSETLKAIGRQTTTNILFDPDSVQNKVAPPLRGTLTVKEAIEYVLRGTKLIARQFTVDTVLIQ